MLNQKDLIVVLLRTSELDRLAILIIVTIMMVTLFATPTDAQTVPKNMLHR